MKQYIASFTKICLEIFLPEECLSCQKLGETICEDCLIKISETKNKRSIGIDWLETTLDYQKNDIKNIFYHLKYHHNKLVARYLAKIVYEKFLRFSKDKTELKDLFIVSIPISQQRKLERGYNQTEILIEEICKQIFEKEKIDLKTKFKNDFLIKNKHTIKFSNSHNKEERTDLIKNAFSLNKKYLNSTNKKIILVDDITTTGATFYEARKVLLDNNFKKENIFAFALAH